MEFSINRQKQLHTVKEFLRLMKMNYCRIIKAVPLQQQGILHFCNTEYI